ncbi:centrosomal protein of 290 kDa-like isoform X2 [Apostichopus japonicus]|uniref:centrosomal protein of 290 kDa-like isoform X2 n=1 Tax=Stichopus japonicus TaxID=307972 RepID=UPI003AB13969
MAPIDWDRVMTANVEGLSEDDADEFYEVLAEADDPKGSDEEQLLKLFEVTRSVMLVKATQAVVALDELEKMAANQGKENVYNDQGLKDQIQELEEENKRLQRMGGGAGSRDMRSLQNEIHELSRQVDLLQRELKDKDRELMKERKDGERFAQRAEDAEKETRELKRDNDLLKNDLRDYQRQMESQRESLLQKRGDDVEYQDKLRQKNRDLNEQLEEIQNLTEANDQLQKQVSDMSEKLKNAAEEMEWMSKDYSNLKLVLQKSDTVTENLNQENIILKEQISELSEQVQANTGTDDEVMQALNKKVDEWKTAMKVKDEEINQLNRVIRGLRDQLTASEIDTDKTSVQALATALKQKDSQLEVLKQELEQSAQEMEEQAQELEQLRQDAVKGGAPQVKLQNQVKQLKEAMKEQEREAKAAEERTQRADADAREKDRELNEALNRMREYEMGEYGLSDAVQEIKECKKKISQRDVNIEQLTQQVNKLDLRMNDLIEENEELRGRLGLDINQPIDMDQAKLSRGLQHQQDRALNQVLSKEVERLEEERIVLKKQIRTLASQRAQRAVALGLTSDDLVALDEYAVELKNRKKAGSGAPEGSVRTVDTSQLSDSLRLKAHRLEQDIGRAERESERLRQESSQHKVENKRLLEENGKLEKEMKNLVRAVHQSEGSGVNMDILGPSLERLLAMFEKKTGSDSVDYEAHVYLKAQVDQLTGRNEELRRELRQARNECDKSMVEFDKAKTKITRLEQELKDLRDLGQGGGVMTMQQMPLPQGLAVSSAEVISSLNEQLIQTLQELTTREEQLSKCDSALVIFRRKFAVLRHQQGLLYKEQQQTEDEWKKKEQEWKDDKVKLQEANSLLDSRVKEYNRLLDTLNQSGDEQQKRMSDVTRKITVLRVNEQALTRRYKACQDAENMLRKENLKLRNEVVDIQSAISERMGYLQRQKEMLQFKVASLQRSLDESVPSADLEKYARDYKELAVKYRDMLQNDNKLVARNARMDELESENAKLEENVEVLKKELSTEKEKLHTLEQAMQEFGNIEENYKGRSSGMDETRSLSKRLTVVEMKELNERQKADHAVRMQDKLRNTVHELEKRNMELEDKFETLTKINLAAQKTEEELRDELSKCVTKAVSDIDRRKIVDLEKSNHTLSLENERLKEMVDVSNFQNKALEAQQISREKEVQSLRQQLLDIQTQSDEKAIIGKLHHHIVALQVSEGTAVRKLEAATTKIRQLEVQLLRMDKHLDEREQSLYHCQVDSRNRSRHLRLTIQELRRQYSGTAPLADLEKFSKVMMQLKQDKEKMEKEMKVIKHEREEVNTQLLELEVKHQGLQELIQTLKDSRGAAKVSEWHAKMQEVRLQDLRLNRQISRLQQQFKYQENMISTHEQTINNLEKENIHIGHQAEERQLLWEHREAELERMIDSLERQQKQMADAAHRFEEATGSLPDPSLPVASQLEHAIRTIKIHIKTILDFKEEKKQYDKKLSESDQRLKEVEANLLTRDKIINELRLRLPASSDRDEVIKDGMSAGVAFKEIVDCCEHKQALKVAQTQIEGLQIRIQQKEENLQKYIDLLDQSRQESADESKNYMQEIHQLQVKLHAQSDIAFNKFKKAAMDLASKPAAPVPGSKELAKLHELEDIVAQQDNSLAAMSLKLKAAQTETAKWKDVLQRTQADNKQKKERLQEIHEEEKGELQKEIERHLITISEREGDIKLLNEQLDQQIQANTKAPSATMKALVERLKNELALKEGQHKSLSQALLQLRADMVETAQESAKAHASEQEQQINVQALVDKETKKIKEHADELQAKMEKARKEVKRQKDKVASLTDELDGLRKEVERRRHVSTKVEEEKMEMEKKMRDLESSRSDLHQVPEKDVPDVAVLQKRIRALQGQISDLKKTEGKETEDPKRMQSAVEVARWEESKKWEKKLENMRSKIKDKDKEIDQLQKSYKMMKDIHERSERIKTSRNSELFSKQAGPTQAEMDELNEKNRRLQDEVFTLRRQQSFTQDSAVQELENRNQFLTGKVSDLQKQLIEKEMVTSRPASVLSATAPRSSSHDEDNNLQKKVLELSQENIELRFELEQAKVDLPRLKERVTDLQKYNDALKADLEKAKRKLKGSSSHGSSKGTSGKSIPELERTIGLMKKVVERVQTENETLKKAPGVTTQTEIHSLREENKTLKSELEKLKLQVGGQLSTRYENTQRGIAKMVTENDRLRQDLHREVESAEKHRINHSRALRDKERLERQIEEVKEKQEIEQARGPKLETADSKSWKSIVVTRMYEEKMKGMEEEMDKKNSSLGDMKRLLRDAAHREQELLHEVRDLQEKVSVLEKFPNDITSDSDLVQQLQHTRLKVNRLENEKAELLNEMKIRKLQTGAENGTEDSEFVERLRSNTKLMEENVEIRTELKTKELESEKIKRENEKLRGELEQFDPSFFEEIEDLKYNYREAMQRNVQYEEELRNLSQQFGVTVHIPP